jgi:hypothetical protein
VDYSYATKETNNTREVLHCLCAPGLPRPTSKSRRSAAQRIFEELRKVGYAGSCSPVKRQVRKRRPPKRLEPSLPTPDYGPGRIGESGWSPHTIDEGLPHPFVAGQPLRLVG